MPAPEEVVDRISVNTYRVQQVEQDISRLWEEMRLQAAKAEIEHARIAAEIAVLKEYKDVYSEPIREAINSVRELIRWREQWTGRVQAGGAILIILSLVNVALQIADRLRGP